MNLPKELVTALKKISTKDWIEIKKTLKNPKERIKLYKHISQIIVELKNQDKDQEKIFNLKKKFNIK